MADLRGLSPRVRGNLLTKTTEELTQRSIPACTGEPPEQGRYPFFARVYPRVYGGTRASGPSWRHSAGLSPRVRGNPEPQKDELRLLGSIPACTGEPTLLLNPCKVPPVYPRVYGGTLRFAGAWVVPRGLSPRVRGNQGNGSTPPNPKRSIPACTGEPGKEKSDMALIRVYPRVYGGTSITRVEST